MARPAADDLAHGVADPADAGESEELDPAELAEERAGEVQDDLESLTSEVVESLDDRGDAEDDETAVTEPEPEPAPEPEAERDPEPEPAAAPERPTVVTRTRRRSASRPAGPPPPMDQAPTSIGSDRDGAVGAPAADGIVEPGTAEGEPGIPTDDEAGGPGHVEHVPIKRKRSRKR